MALGTLILNAFSVRAAPGRFIRCRCSAIQNNVQTNTYDPDGPERHRRFYLAVLIGPGGGALNAASAWPSPKKAIKQKPDPWHQVRRSFAGVDLQIPFQRAARDHDFASVREDRG